MASQPQEPESSEGSYHGSSSSASSPPNSRSDITDEGLHTPEVKGPGQVVRVPDLFSSIMAAQPVVNPNYHKVKPEADAWITEVIQADEKWSSRNCRVDLAFLASIWAPTCDEVALRMMIDWNHWVKFDEGHLSRDPEAAQEEINRTLAIMDNIEPPVRREDNAIRYQQRWKAMHRQFFDGLLTQVKTMHDQRVFGRDVQEYLDMRRGTIGAYPAIALTEYALGINLPAEVMRHPSCEEFMCISADLVLLVNDILSYKKDLALGVDHNLIFLLRSQGLSIQQAVDRIGEMLEDCYKRWYTALGNLDIWGEKVDKQVLSFADACRNVALGNLHWSFKTGRYLGPEGDQVHETRLLRLPE
ncbi:isoprenoid synthase domain-containing protein [Aspergillus egyptiacus]|nr:isoprenoid synthase domain-containing protein [Aspergillus egyptiacus]